MSLLGLHIQREYILYLLYEIFYTTLFISLVPFYCVFVCLCLLVHTEKGYLFDFQCLYGFLTKKRSPFLKCHGAASVYFPADQNEITL